MSPLAQFAAGFLGAAAGIGIVSLFTKGPRHLVRGLFIALAVAFSIPIYKLFFGTWKYGILLWPLIGGVLAGIGYILGSLVESALKNTKGND